MTLLAVSDLVGLSTMPTTSFGVRKWLKSNGISVEQQGKRFIFALSDLPAEVRRAVIERDIAAAGLPLGTYDEAAHQDLAGATPKMRAGAERRAAIARDLTALGSQVPWAERITIVRGRHGGNGTSKPSLIRIIKAVEGVDPINFAPALLAEYSRGGCPQGGNVRGRLVDLPDHHPGCGRRVQDQVRLAGCARPEAPVWMAMARRVDCVAALECAS